MRAHIYCAKIKTALKPVCNQTIAYRTVNGVKVALLGFSPLNGATKQQIKEGIPKAKQKKAKIIIVSCLTLFFFKRGDIMIAITATKAREHIYQLIQDVNTNCAPVTITNQKGKNAVLIGEEDWKAIEETLHLMAIPGMAESIIEGGKTAIEDCLEENEVDW